MSITSKFPALANRNFRWYMAAFTISMIGSWMQAGADGFGFGSELFKPAYTLREIESRARQLVQCFAAATSTT